MTPSRPVSFSCVLMRGEGSQFLRILETVCFCLVLYLIPLYPCQQSPRELSHSPVPNPHVRALNEQLKPFSLLQTRELDTRKPGGLPRRSEFGPAGSSFHTLAEPGKTCFVFRWQEPMTRAPVECSCPCVRFASQPDPGCLHPARPRAAALFLHFMAGDGLDTWATRCILSPLSRSQWEGASHLPGCPGRSRPRGSRRAAAHPDHRGSRHGRAVVT